MAESTLSLAWADLMNAVAEYFGYGRETDPNSPTAWTAADKAHVQRMLDNGYRQFLGVYDWSWKYPRTSFVAWASIAESTITATSSTATLTATADSFYRTMIGRKVKINALSGTDAGTMALSAGVTTLDATAAIFTTSSDDVGATLVFDTSGEEYTIKSVVDTDTVTLTGDATATTSNSGDTFKVYREYTISAYTSATVVTLSAAPNPVISAKFFSIAATGEYRMPDDFGGLIGAMLFDAGAGDYVPLKKRNQEQVRRLLQGNTSGSRPRDCAIEPLASDGTTGQRFDALVYPIPDSNRTLYYRFMVLPDALTNTIAYALGGMANTQVLQASCLQQAELDRDGAPGPMAFDYERQLGQAIAQDNRNRRAESLGRMIDPEFDWAREGAEDTRITPGTPTLYYDGVAR
jgi:hypothetical protein